MADRRKRRKKGRGADASNERSGDDTNKSPKRDFRVDSLEQRILLSATWVDAEIEIPGMIEVEGEGEAFGEGDGTDDLLDVLDVLGGDQGDGDILVAEEGDDDGAASVVSGAEPLATPFTPGENGYAFEIQGTFPEIEVPTAIDVPGHDVSPSDLEGSHQEIVFIDPGVQRADALHVAMEPGVEVVQLHADRDGVTQIADMLRGRSGVDAIHVISHGQSGALHLGSGTLDASSVGAEHARALETIRGALSEGAAFTIRGADFGSADGADTVAALSAATGVEVATIDDTGSHDLADEAWDLGGGIDFETDNAFAATPVHEWGDVLAMGSDDTVLADLGDALQGEGVILSNLTASTLVAPDGAVDPAPAGLEEGAVFTTAADEPLDPGADIMVDATDPADAVGQCVVIEFDARVLHDTLGLRCFLVPDAHYGASDRDFAGGFTCMVSGPGIDGEVDLAAAAPFGTSAAEPAPAESVFDGRRLLVTGEVDVDEGATYHIRMALPDFGDTYVHDMVFLDHFFSADAEPDTAPDASVVFTDDRYIDAAAADAIADRGHDSR